MTSNYGTATAPRPSSDERENLGSGRVAFILTWALTLLVLAFAFWHWWARRDDVARLPAADRHALYERTRDTLSRFCDPERALHGISNYCQQQAALLVQFPECAADCRQIADPFRPHPTR